MTTSDDGAVGIAFVDGMTFSLGSDARMVLDEFVYKPEGQAYALYSMGPNGVDDGGKGDDIEGN